MMKPLAAVIAATSLSPTLALAQGGASQLEEVVVTAQFREQNLQDTPIAISAITGDMLAAQNIMQLNEIAQKVPSVQLNTVGNAFGPSIQAYIRGIGQYDFNPAYEPGVGMYIDDVYHGSLLGAQFDLMDVSRVEVLRGPQGTLTGRNSIGGAIKMYSVLPGEEAGGYIEGRYGSRNLFQVRGAADIPLSDNLFARVTGSWLEQDGWFDLKDYGCANPNNPEGIPATTTGGCTTEELGDRGNYGIRGQLRYVQDSWTLNLAADYMKQEQNPAAARRKYSANPNYICGDDCAYANYYSGDVGPHHDFYRTLGFLFGDEFPPLAQGGSAPQNPEQKFEGNGIQANLDIDLTENLQLQSITSYREFNTTFDTDDDWGPEVAFDANGVPPGVGGGENDIDYENFSQEIRLNWEVNDGFYATVGAFYMDQTTDYWTKQDIRTLPGIIFPGYASLQFIGDDSITLDSWAVFASTIIDITDRLTITAGVRYTEENKDYDWGRFEWDGETFHYGLGGLNGVVSEYEGDEMDYRLSADYKLTDDIMLYATYSTGFKGGGVTARPFHPNDAIYGTFDPETIDNYEIGAKMDLLDRTLRLNIAAYMYEYSDIQLPISDCTVFGSPPGPCAAWQNAGTGDAEGIEVELNWSPVDRLAIDAAYSYYSFEWTDVDLDFVAGFGAVNDAFATPENQWNVGAQYTFDLAGGSLTPRVDVSYTDERFVGNGAVLGPVYLDDYTYVNASVGWKNKEEDLSVTLFAKNLTDEIPELGYFSAYEGLIGMSYVNLGAQREFSIAVKKEF